MQGSDKAMAAHEQHRQIASLHFVNDSCVRSSLSHFVNVEPPPRLSARWPAAKHPKSPSTNTSKWQVSNWTQIRDQRCFQVQGTEALLAIRCRETLRKEALDIWAADEAVVFIRIRHIQIKADLKNTAFKKHIPEFACPSYPRSPLARHRWARDPVGYPTRLAEKSTLFVDLLPFWCWGFPQSSKPISQFLNLFFQHTTSSTSSTWSHDFSFDPRPRTSAGRSSVGADTKVSASPSAASTSRRPPGRSRGATWGCVSDIDVFHVISKSFPSGFFFQWQKSRA